MSTLNVNTIQTLSGGKHSRVVFSGYFNNIVSGITWSSGYNGTTQILGNVSGGTGSNVRALIVGIFYQHNGSTNHGYLSGYYHQTGKNYATEGMENLQAHYDWYYNYLENLIIIPWDPNGTQSLSISNISAYNTSSANEYRFYQRGWIVQN